MATNAEAAMTDVKTFGAKFGTKAEIYRFLTVEASLYLPPYETITIWHMRDLASGDKTVSTQLYCQRQYLAFFKVEAKDPGSK